MKNQILTYHSVWKIRHWRKDPNGIYRLIWEEPDGVDRNILHSTGEIAILSAFFATGMTNYGAPPANLYIGLDTRSSLDEGNTLASLVELSKSGYERKALSSAGTGASGQDFYINKPATYYRADSKVVEWTAGENWGTAVKNIFLCTDATATSDDAGKHLICSLALSAERTLLSGDKLDGSIYIGLSE